MNLPHRTVATRLSEYQLPIVTLGLVVVAQLATVVSQVVDVAVHSVLGTFLQAAAVSVSFGPVTTGNIRKGRQDRRYRALFERLTEYSLARRGLQCQQLEDEFLHVPLLSRLCSDGQSAIRKSTPSECAVFVLGYQFYGHELEIPNFDPFCLTEIADCAAEYPPYRYLVLADALRTVLPEAAKVRALVREIEKKATTRFRVSSRTSDADQRLESRIMRSREEELIVVSTTSQVSGFFLDVLHRREANISEVKVVCLSPRILSHGSISSQSLESTVPVSVIPTGQQIDDPRIDNIRRVVRILTGIASARKRFGSSRMDIRFLILKERHPGLKVRLLSRSGYLQLFPGNLRYAGNLYRFGYEIEDRQLVERFTALLGDWLDISGEPLGVNDAEIQDLEERSISELARSLLGTERPAENIAVKSTMLFSLLPDEYGRDILGKVFNVIAQGVDSTAPGRLREAVPSQWDVYVPAGRPIVERQRGLALTPSGAHVSVGAFIECDGKMLVVKKVTAPNRGLWSIPAGHCEWGECPAVSIVRELREEIGVLPKEPTLIYTGEIDEGRPCRHGAARHLWFLYRIQFSELPEITLQAEELRELKWVDNTVLGRLRKTPALEALLEKTSGE